MEEPCTEAFEKKWGGRRWERRERSSPATDFGSELPVLRMQK
jgi:hypothetical protein